MALIGTVTIADTQIKDSISSISWGVLQRVIKGDASGGTHHTDVELIFKNIHNSVFYYEWADNKAEMHDVTITFDITDDKQGVISTLYLTKALCNGFQFVMDRHDQNEITLHVTLSAAEISYVKGTESKKKKD